MHAPTEVDVAIAQLTETLHQSSESFWLSRSRWWLAGIGQAVPWLKEVSVPGIWHLLDRFDLAYKRGRRYVHSPDPDYQPKSARLRCAWQEVREDPVHFVLLYQDELTSYRCPTTASAYAGRGSDGPRGVPKNMPSLIHCVLRRPAPATMIFTFLHHLHLSR